MPIIDGETHRTLVAAVKSPAAYVTGAKRKKLNAAFDLAVSKIFAHVFKYQANPTMIRRKLNSAGENEIPPEFRALVESLKIALKSATPLRSKAYPGEGENDDNLVSFVETNLSDLLNELNAVE